MPNSNTIYPELDLSSITGRGKTMSSQEAMEDIIPVQWSDEILNGKYCDTILIKSPKREE